MQTLHRLFIRPTNRAAFDIRKLFPTLEMYNTKRHSYKVRGEHLMKMCRAGFITQSVGCLDYIQSKIEHNKIEYITHQSSHPTHHSLTFLETFNMTPPPQDIFSSLSAFCWDLSLFNSLVHSTLPSKPSPLQALSPATIGNTCPYTCSLTSIQRPQRSFQGRQWFTRSSSNLIYCVRISRSGLLYFPF